MRPLEEREILRVLRKHPGLPRNAVVCRIPAGCRYEAALALPRMIARQEVTEVRGRCFAPSLAAVRHLAHTL